MGRQKQVSNYDEVTHWWANQSQEHGRTTGNRLFFHGASIYSYGRHFEIARHVTEGKTRVILFNSASYSVTTSKHQAAARSAARHLDSFQVPSFTDHVANVRYFLAAVESAHSAAVRAVKNVTVHSDAMRTAAENAAEYVEVFKKHVPTALRNEARRVARLARDNRLFSAAELAKIAQAHARRAAADKRDAEERERRRVEWEAAEPARAMNREHAEALEMEEQREAPAILARWAAGESDDLPSSYYRDDALGTRLRLKDGRIETSRRAQITERRARELWIALVRGADVTGQELDNYRVTSWDGARLIVGCHDIARAELEHMARVLGLPGSLPAAPKTCIKCGAPWDEARGTCTQCGAVGAVGV